MGRLCPYAQNFLYVHFDLIEFAPQIVTRLFDSSVSSLTRNWFVMHHFFDLPGIITIRHYYLLATQLAYHFIKFSSSTLLGLLSFYFISVHFNFTVSTVFIPALAANVLIVFFSLVFGKLLCCYWTIG